MNDETLTDCRYCDGGQVTLYTQTYSETIDCPECNGTGLVTPAEARAQEQELEAARRARERMYD